jgi:hypothetical protein
LTLAIIKITSGGKQVELDEHDEEDNEDEDDIVLSKLKVCMLFS